jgi:hypothetical protein
MIELDNLVNSNDEIKDCEYIKDMKITQIGLYFSASWSEKV